MLSGKFRAALSAKSSGFPADALRARRLPQVCTWTCLACLIALAAGPACAQNPANFAGDPISNAEQYGTLRQLDLQQRALDETIRQATQARNRLEALRTTAAEGPEVRISLDPRGDLELVRRGGPVGWNCMTLDDWGRPVTGSDRVCKPSRVAIEVRLRNGQGPVLYPIVDDNGGFRLPPSYRGTEISFSLPVDIPGELVGRPSPYEGSYTQRMWATGTIAVLPQRTAARVELRPVR